jgi:hypothetical protein
MRGPHPGITGNLPATASPSSSRTTTATEEASGSVNRCLRPLAQSDPDHADHPTGLMIADAVRYMSAHSWTQCDSHGLSGTSSG